MNIPTLLSHLLVSQEAVEAMPHAPEVIRIDADLGFNANMSSNVFLIQSFISLLNRSATTTLEWYENSVDQFLASPCTYGFLACMILHSNVRHTVSNGSVFPIKKARLAIQSARLSFDWFSEPKALLCGDDLGLGRQRELYISSTSTGIRSREHFESLIYPYVEAQLAVSVEEKNAFKWRAALTSIVFELFENTELHGKTDWQGKVLKNSIRGLLLKDIEVHAYQANQAKNPKSIRCLEIGVFDSGVGYFSKNRKKPLSEDVPIQEEWDVLHQCLSTHLEDGTAPIVGKGQRGIGLYEVLRALKFLNGAIEFRTGRLHAYRSFLPGDLLLQMESSESKLRPNMPKPTLLDYSSKYLSRPTKETSVIGSAVRVLIPV
jgi:hypothetical protein